MSKAKTDNSIAAVDLPAVRSYQILGLPDYLYAVILSICYDDNIDCWYENVDGENSVVDEDVE